MPEQIDPATGEIRDPGREYPDPTPVAKPVGWKPPHNLQETIRRFVRDEMSRLARGQEMETFEEADDFDVGDDYDPKSPHELDEEADSLPTWKEDKQREAALLDAEKKIADRYASQEGSGMGPDEPTSRRTGKGGAHPAPRRKNAPEPASEPGDES